jgi:hypothetical protein
MRLIVSHRKSPPLADWPAGFTRQIRQWRSGRVAGWFLLVAVSLFLMPVAVATDQLNPQPRQEPAVEPPAKSAVLPADEYLAPPDNCCGATSYYSNRYLSGHLALVAKEHPDLVRVVSIAQSLGKREVWLVEMGQGAEADRKTRPAMLLVAGIEGADLIGCSAAVSWVKRLVEQYKTCSDITELLDTTTIYVIPRLNADAAEHFFNSREAGALDQPKFETSSASGGPVDDDHDGLVDEDGPEDLNGDGLITWMRVEDREGEYILDPADDRLLVKADHLKGEVGKWRYLTEGIDNDRDEQWNEDGPGGVNFNRNFPYNYEFFAPDAGLHQVSEAETRALAEFVVGHPNIGIVVTYGAADNLLKTPGSAPSAPAPSGEGRSRGRKPTPAIDEKDLPYYRVMGEKYRESLGLKKEMEGASYPGTFSDWMYFHRGRLSLAACPWSPALGIELSKANQKKEKAEPGDSTDAPDQDKEPKSATQEGDKEVSEKSKTDQDKRNEERRKELKWFDEYAPEAFIRWQPIEHPDFPGQRVEVGGYCPFSQSNPPLGMIGDIAARHADFLTKVAQQLPRIGIRKVEAKRLGEDVYEIRIQVENTGFLSTSLAHGQTTREVYPTRIIIEMDNKCFLSGSRITNLPTIQGSRGMAEVRYVIYAPNRAGIHFKIVSMLAGQAEGTIELAKTRSSSLAGTKIEGSSYEAADKVE